MSQVQGIKITATLESTDQHTAVKETFLITLVSLAENSEYKRDWQANFNSIF